MISTNSFHETSLFKRCLAEIWTIERKTENFLEEIFCYFSFKIILPVTSKFLSKNWGIRTAILIGFCLFFFPRRGNSIYNTMRQAFGATPKETIRLAHGWLTQPFRDFVVLRHILYGREHPSDWQFVEKTDKAVEAIRRSGKSFILATGHFSREPMMLLYLKRVLPGYLFQIANPLPGNNKGIYNKRMMLQFGTTLETVKYLRPDDLEIVTIGSGSDVYRKIINCLKNPGNIVMIHIDPSWETKGSHSFNRFFAGQLNRCLSFGTARIARLAKCPIVTCIPYRENDESIILEWESPVSILDDDPLTDIQVMNKLLEKIETAIGKRPTQYVLPIGSDRHWDRVSQCWKNPERKLNT